MTNQSAPVQIAQQQQQCFRCYMNGEQEGQVSATKERREQKAQFLATTVRHLPVFLTKELVEKIRIELPSIRSQAALEK